MLLIVFRIFSDHFYTTITWNFSPLKLLISKPFSVHRGLKCCCTFHCFFVLTVLAGTRKWGNYSWLDHLLSPRIIRGINFSFLRRLKLRKKRLFLQSFSWFARSELRLIMKSALNIHIFPIFFSFHLEIINEWPFASGISLEWYFFNILGKKLLLLFDVGGSLRQKKILLWLWIPTAEIWHLILK